jgi:integrase
MSTTRTKGKISQKAHASRTAKVRALIKRPGSPGERLAAEAALERLGAARKPSPATRVVHLEAAVIKGLTPPASGNQVHWDDEVAGFGCRVTAAGTKAYVFNYRVRGSGQQRRITIGQFPNWTVGAARGEAKRLRKLVDGGSDPRGEFEESKAAPTVADLADRFEREFLPRKRPATQDSYSRLLRLYIRPHFGLHTKVADVTYAHIDKLHQKVTAGGSVYSANRCVAVCSKMFSLAIRWQMRTDNPCRGIERNPESKRKRYLAGDELKRLTTALAEHPDRHFAAIIGLLLLTGARRGEVLAMRWGDLTLAKDKGIWSKPGSTTKQKTDHVVPLSAPAVALLSKIKTRGEFVFQSSGATGHIVEIKKAWASLCKAAGIAGLRVHDLRHSFASQLVSSGASLPLIGALLGHSSPATTHRYSHLFDDPQRAAVEKVGVIIGDAGKGGR